MEFASAGCRRWCLRVVPNAHYSQQSFIAILLAVKFPDFRCLLPRLDAEYPFKDDAVPGTHLSISRVLEPAEYFSRQHFDWGRFEALSR